VLTKGPYLFSKEGSAIFNEWLWEIQPKVHGYIASSENYIEHPILNEHTAHSHPLKSFDHWPNDYLTGLP
jgi:hypothetical protein